MGFDSDLDGDVSFDLETDSDSSFTVFNLQNLSAFLMMFGLSGLSLLEGAGLSHLFAVGGAVVIGLISVRAIVFILTQFNKLQSSGTIDNSSAVGTRGTVYLSIKPGEVGQVQISIQNRFRIMDATSMENEELVTGQPIEVVDIMNGRTLIVKQIHQGDR